jgi:MOSC domain-containing protein YiiM
MSEGRIAGIARRDRRRAPMQEIARAFISTKTGLEGDFKGGKYPLRQITVLAREDWEEAVAELGAPDLSWTARRANLLVAGIALPRAKGGLIRIGPALLEVTGQTYPCARMDEARQGLLEVLGRTWRGGVTCRVLEGGQVALGDAVEVPLRPPPERVPRLPG